MAERWWHRRELQRTARAVPEHLRARHVGIIMDGNRRWARRHHLATSEGHRIGAEHVADLLRWSERWSINHLSVYVLSADNIRKRDSTEVANLFALLATTVPDAVTGAQEWSLHLSGDLGLVPEPSRGALTDAVTPTAGRPRHVTMAIGYDARRDILEGIRGALRAGSAVEVDDVTRHLDGGPVKDIDLVIRTGGDQRISGFFPWQAAQADIVFVRAPWPSFRELDLARALALHARNRRTPAQ